MKKQLIVITAITILLTVNFMGLTESQEIQKNPIWGMTGNNPQITGKSPFSTEYNLGDYRWNITTNHTINLNGLVIDGDGNIYVMGIDGSKTIIHSITPCGKTRWKKYIDGGFYGNADLCILSAESGRLSPDGNYILFAGLSNYSEGSTRLTAIDSYDGSVLGQVVRFSSELIVSNLLAINNNIYYGTDKGYLYKVNVTLWEEEWRVSGIYAKCIAEKDGILYVAGGEAGSGKLYAVYSENGTIKWTQSIGSYAGYWCAVWNNRVYTSAGYSLRAFDLNGNLLWTQSFSDYDEFAYKFAVGEDGTVYIISKDVSGHLWAIDENGERIWSIFFSDINEATQPVISNEGHIFVTAKSKLYCYYPNGTMRWSVDIGGNGILAISFDGTVIVRFGTQVKAINTFYVEILTPREGEVINTDSFELEWIVTGRCVSEFILIINNESQIVLQNVGRNFTKYYTTIVGLENGNYTLTLKVISVEGDYKEASVNITVAITEGIGGEEKGKEGYEFNWLYLLLILLILAIIIATYIILRKRGRKTLFI